MKTFLVALLLTLSLPAYADTVEIPVPFTEVSPYGCALNQPVITGWYTAATLVVHPAARALSLRTTNEFESQLRDSPSTLTDGEWLDMIRSLENGDFQAALAMVGGTASGEVYLAVSVAYEVDGEWRCSMLSGSERFPFSDNLNITIHD